MILHYRKNIVVFLCATSFIQTTFSYIIPVCSEYGGICNEYGENCQRYTEEHSAPDTAALFRFVTQSMDVARKFIYEWILGLEAPKPVQVKKQSYMDMMWSYLGFSVAACEVTQAEEEADDNKYNLSFIGLVGASYFGYIFLATHYMNRKNEAEKKYFARKFSDYLSSGQESISDDDMPSEEDSNDSSSIKISRSRCIVCEKHKLAMERLPENTKEIKAKQISLPIFGLSKSSHAM